MLPDDTGLREKASAFLLAADSLHANHIKQMQVHNSVTGVEDQQTSNAEQRSFLMLTHSMRNLKPKDFTEFPKLHRVKGVDISFKYVTMDTLQTVHNHSHI